MPVLHAARAAAEAELLRPVSAQVRFYYSFTSTDNLYIVMEYVSGGDTFSLLKQMGALDEEFARIYVAETVLALEYCHTQVRSLQPHRLLPELQAYQTPAAMDMHLAGLLGCVGMLSSVQALLGTSSSHEVGEIYCCIQPATRLHVAGHHSPRPQARQSAGVQGRPPEADRLRAVLPGRHRPY